MKRNHLKNINIVITLIGLLSSLLGTFLTASPVSADTVMDAINPETTVAKPVENHIAVTEAGPDIDVIPAEYTYIEDSMQTSGEQMPDFQTGMSNPAATYCQELGYDYRTATNPFGQVYSTCQLDSVTSCPAWDFLDGTCGKEYNACTQNGMDTVVSEDGRNSYGQVYAQCVKPGLDQVIMATDLVDMHITTNYTPELSLGLSNAITEPENSIQSVEASLPATFDWRNVNGQNWLTPIRDQGSCGSCWAFAAVGVVEASANISNDNSKLDLDLAEQALVGDCCVGCGNCTSGNHVQALYYVKNTGIPDEGCFPYQADDNSGCNEGCSDMNDRLHKIDSVNYLGTDPDYAVIKQALMEHGPMVGPMYHTSGGTWNNGIFSCSSSTSINHSVVLVGWDDNAGAWIVRNSWGEEWNDGGYYKVAYGTCAVERYLYYIDSSAAYTDVTITNDGASNLTVTDIKVEGDSCWLNVDYEGPLPADVATGEAFGFDLSFDKTCVDYGTYSDAVLIYSNDSNESPTRVPVTFTYPDGPVGPDIEATSDGTSSDPIIIGQPVTWNVDVANIGNTATGSDFNVRFKVADSCTSAETGIRNQAITALASGESTEIEFTYTFNELGTVALIALADNLSQVSETTESNNRLCIEREVVEVPAITCYPLNLSRIGAGSVEASTPPNCGSNYEEGTVVTLTANPNTDWEFTSWNGDLNSSTNPETITINNTRSVVATFGEIAPICYDLNLNTVGNGDVEVSPAPNCGDGYEEGTVVSFIANPDTDWTFANWDGDLSSSSNPEAITMDNTHMVVANFSEVAPTCYILNLSSLGQGSIEASPAPNCGYGYEEGTVVTLTANADTGWDFSKWSGGLTGGTNPESLTITKNKFITANFVEEAPVCYYLNLVTSGQGSVEASPAPNCGNGYETGTVVTITANPAAGWDFNKWSGGLTGRTNPETVTVTKSKYIVANFVEETPVCYGLVLSTNGMGSIEADTEPNCGYGYEEGTVVTLTATPSAGWSFLKWNGGLTGSANPGTITITKNRYIVANFIETDGN